MKGKTCIWALGLLGLLLVLTACAKDEAQARDPGREVKEIALKDEGKDLLKDFEPKKLDLNVENLGEVNQTYSGGYLDGKVHVFVSLENTSLGQYSDKGKVIMEQGNEAKELFSMDQAPAEINELYGDKVYSSWVASDAESTSLYLYDGNKGERKVLETYPQAHQGVLNFMGKDQVLWRKDQSILSYNFKTEEKENLADDVGEDSGYIRPEVSGKTLAYETKDGVAVLNLEDKSRVDYTVSKPGEIYNVKASPNYLVWGLKDQQKDALWIYDRREDRAYRLNIGKEIFSYHLSQSTLALNLRDTLLVLDLDKNTRDGYELENGQVADYGRVMPDGTIEFALEGEELSYLLIKPR